MTRSVGRNYAQAHARAVLPPPADPAPSDPRRTETRPQSAFSGQDADARNRAATDGDRLYRGKAAGTRGRNDHDLVARPADLLQSHAVETLPGPAHVAPALRPGVRPLSPEELDNQLRFVLGALPDDARKAARWLLRGPLASSIFLPTFVRRMLLRLGGVKIGASVWGLERGWYQSPHIAIGDGTGIGAGCTFEGSGRIDIGANCMIAAETMIITSIHPISPDGQIARFSEPRDVRIDDGCWLGMRVTVMPGVRIGAGVVVGAGAVVTKNCEPGGLYAGVPARRIR